MIMRRMILMITVFHLCVTVSSQERDSLLTMFWNLENFFDYTDQGTGESDTEFSSFGSRHWTKKKFHRKCDNIAKAILWMEDRYGRVPDVIGFAEIENRGVIYDLLNNTLLRKYDYEVVHKDSPDRRGIDVALIYRRSSFRLISASWNTPGYDGEPMDTRDIQHACLEDTEGQCIHFLVNHHPSKYGGSKESEGRRAAAMETMKQVCDSLAGLSDHPVVAMGDYNDNPDGPAFDIIEGTLVNKGTLLHAKGEGSIRYEGKWDLIDNYLVSPSIQECTEMEVCRVPFLMTWERKHPGEKPFRTYSGPRYIGGVSDHCPVILWYFKDNSYL
jgi:predicted extracellular nuclease